MSKSVNPKASTTFVGSHIIEIVLAIIVLVIFTILGALIMTRGNSRTDNVIITDNGVAIIKTLVPTTAVANVTVTVIPTVTPNVSKTVTPTPKLTLTPTITPTPVGIAIYFAKPTSGSDYATIAAVYRDNTVSGTQKFIYIINQILAGPTAAEKTAGFTAVMTLPGTSNCNGSSYQIVRSGNTLTVNFCKPMKFVTNVGSGSTYMGYSSDANTRMTNALKESLKVDGISTVVINGIQMNVQQ